MDQELMQSKGIYATTSRGCPMPFRAKVGDHNSIRHRVRKLSPNFLIGAAEHISHQ
jgi:hypothetical protein